MRQRTLRPEPGPNPIGRDAAEARDGDFPISLWAALLATLLVLGAFVQDAGAGARVNDGKFCTTTAKAARTACKNEVDDDYWITIGNCTNFSDPIEGRACDAEAQETRAEERDFCGEQYGARLDLCDSLGEAVYEPSVTPLAFGGGPVPLFLPANFPEDPTHTIFTANPYLPFLVPGLEWVYQLRDENDEVVEHIVVTVEEEVKNVGGVNCLTVRDVVTESDEEDAPVVEDTLDWYAQDHDGNVWYCGEIALNFEVFEEDPDPQAELVDIEGSWKAYRESATPGIVMLANPVVGDVYRQEFALGNAEDAAEVLSTTASEMVPAASCVGDCVVTGDFTPVEPDALEHKYFAPGVGLILEVDPESGERLELVEMTP